MNKKQSQSQNHSSSSERWLVSYADLITLLFALFVILYAMSKADIEKLKKVNQSMKQAFGDAPAGPPIPAPATAPGDTSGATSGSTGSPTAESAAEAAIHQTRDAIQQSVAGETTVADIADKVEISEDDRGLVVRLAARDFFDDGVVEARADLRPLLDRIAKVLLTVPNGVRVEGHTDIEENPKGDWALSASRAAWVVEYWIKRFGMDPARLSAAGLSHFHPLTQRRDDFSRGRNRRIEIIILRDPAKKPDHSV